MIPYSALLIVYGLTVAVVFVYALLNLYHVVRYGRLDATLYFMTGLFIAGFIFILFVSWTFIGRIDWSQSIDVAGTFTFNQPVNR